jgi:hypothetical protein
MIKKRPECIKWGINWALVVIIILLIFFILKFFISKTNSLEILEGLFFICLILLTLFSSPLELLLNIIPGQQDLTIISCKITGCILNFGGIISIILIWFILGILIGLFVVYIKNKINEPSYLKIFKVR